MHSRAIDGDAIEISLNDDGIVELADRFFRLVEVIKDAALGIDRRLRRIQILRPGLLFVSDAALHDASAESDDFALLARYRENNPVAELGIDGADSASFI